MDCPSTFADFKAAESKLQAEFLALEEQDHEPGHKNYMPYVKPVEALDVFYTDGDAARCVGKIVFEHISGLARGYYFFDAEGPRLGSFPAKYDAMFRAWIADVVAAVKAATK